MRDAVTLKNLAASFRRLAETAGDDTAARMLELADEYEALARRREPDPTPPIPAPE